MTITDHIALARHLPSVEAVLALSGESLRALKVQHQTALKQLRRRIHFASGEPHRHAAWLPVARRAHAELEERNLWLDKELRRRQLEEQRQAKLARVAAGNTQEVREIHAFKSVVREVVGEETYVRLWKMVEERLALQQRDSEQVA